MAMRTPCVLAVLALACACTKDDKPKPGPDPGSASGMAPVGSNGSAAVTVAGVVEVFVNDGSVAKVTAEQLAKWPRLDTLVPSDDRRLGTWQVVTIVSKKSTEVAKPSMNYPDMVPALFPGDGGAPSFGMFDPVELAKKGKPGLREDGVREIRIKLATEGRGGDHQGGTGEGSDPSKIVIAIKTPDGDLKFTGNQLLALPRQPMPGNEDTKGWSLKQVLDAAGVKKLGKVTLIDANGTSLILEKAELADEKKLVPFIKLNRQGTLRFRVLKKSGDGWQAGGDLRSIATIQIAK
jgi:hypothetical protein